MGNTSYLEFQFVADAQLESQGVVIEWWSADIETENRPASCKYNGTMASAYQASDHIFGMVYDIYHATYIILLTIIIFYLMYKLFGLLKEKMKKSEEDEDEFLDVRDGSSDSEDDSDD